MIGGHDLGGKHGLGPINPEPESEEPLFHADWERRVFALTLATGMLGQWNIDESRHARERQHPVDYLKQSYYENWLVGLEKLLEEKHLLERANQQQNQQENLRIPDAVGAEKILASGGPTLMPDTAPARFGIGAKVTVPKRQGSGHSRVPAYVQGASGEIVDHYGTHVFPDANARGDRRGEHLYSVRFDGESLWGNESQGQSVFIDLWEPYLEAAAI
jgi:nitrile hydratase beta subunit